MQGIQGATGGGSDRSKALSALIAYGKGAELYEQGKAVSGANDKNGVFEPWFGGSSLEKFLQRYVGISNGVLNCFWRSRQFV